MVFSDYETVAKVHGGKGGRPFTKTLRPFHEETFAGVSNCHLTRKITAYEAGEALVNGGQSGRSGIHSFLSGKDVSCGHSASGKGEAGDYGQPDPAIGRGPRRRRNRSRP